MYLGYSLEYNRLCGSVAFGIGTRLLDLGRSLFALFVVVWPIVIDIVYSRLLPARCLNSDGWGQLNLWCNLLVVAWVASGLVVKMEGILIVGSPLAGLAGLPLTLRRGCHSR